MPEAIRPVPRIFWCVVIVCGFASAITNVDARESAEVEALKAKAADGDSTAQLALASAYESGRGVRANIVEAAKWYEAAAQRGNAEAQNSIGSLYLSGEGVTKDGTKACQWFAKSAAQENVRGIGNLGWCYDAGIGVEKDVAKAAALYEQAANAGDLQSMLNIGVDYWRGEGVEKDLAKAYMWLDLVRFYTQVGRANRMLKWRSREVLDALSKEISPAVRAQAQALTREWDKANRAKVQQSPVY